MSEVRIEEVESLVKHRLGELRRRSFAELRSLAPWATEHVPLGTNTVRLTTYCERLPDGRLEIVVQGSHSDALDRLVWIGVRAEGFWVSSDGHMEPLPDARRFYYM